jgi:hypothetical protein
MDESDMSEYTLDEAVSLAQQVQDDAVDSHDDSTQEE